MKSLILISLILLATSCTFKNPKQPSNLIIKEPKQIENPINLKSDEERIKKWEGIMC